jgi:hypothetical protein
MGAVDIFFAALVLLAAVVAIALLSRMLWRPVWTVSARALKHKRLVRLSSSLEEVDALIESGDWDEALKTLESGIRLEFPSSPLEISTLRDYQHGVLSRCLVISEAKEIQPRALPRVERGIFELAELSVAYLKLARVGSRDSEMGASQLPEIKDPSHQLSAIRSELRNKQREVNDAFNDLFTSLQDRTTTEVMYH